MRHFKLAALQGTAAFVLAAALAFPAQAQVTISEDASTQIRTSTAGPNGTPSDVSIGSDEENNESSPTITATTASPALVLDSANDLTLIGNVRSENIDDSTGVELQGGEDRNYLQTGDISILEDFDQDDTDDDPFPDTPFAEGSGRTGILISGASPFQGNIELAEGSNVTVEGNDSFGINLANTPMMTEGLTGDLLTNGAIGVTGDNSIGVNIGSDVTGDLVHNGTITSRGVGSSGYVINGDVEGGFVGAGAISASGYRFNQRQTFRGPEFNFGREDQTEEDLGQAGSAFQVLGDVSRGVFLQQELTQSTTDGEPNLDEDGEPIFLVTQSPSITQLGGAPAVLFDGQGDPIAIGIVTEITDEDDEDFDENLQFAFINQGSITASGVNDDVDATGVLAQDVTFAGGIRNTGTIRATSFRAPNPTDLADGDGIARALVFGDNAIAEQINNAGLIIATANEASQEIYFDRENIIAPRDLTAIAIDIGEDASLSEIVNSGEISSVLVGRTGQAVAIRDASGTLRSVTNTGVIRVSAQSSDSLNTEDTEFELVALDVSALSDSFTFTQSQSDATTNLPLTIGRTLLGSGDDVIDLQAGVMLGDVDFGGGEDTITLSGESTFIGGISNSDELTVDVSGGSNLSIASSDSIQVASATFDETSTFRPTINGSTGTASTLVSDGEISFAEGSTINPILNSIVGTDTLTYELASADNLNIGDLATLAGGDRPFLYSTELSLSDPNTLVVTLDLRNPDASVAEGGLGLDTVQSAAFNSVIQNLTSAQTLGNAFANLTEADEFYAAYNQILPEFAGAPKQFVIANVDGAVGAVGSHLDVSRRSPDKPGGAWLQEFFYFADRERAGLSEQYRGEGFGFTGGLDTAFGPFHAIGVNAGFASTEVEDVVGIDDPLDVRTYQLGAYAGLASGNFNFDVYGGVGYNEFEQNRRVRIGDFAGTAQGEWDGMHYNATARAGYDIPISKKFWARPSLSVDYLSLNEYGHTETGTEGITLRVDGRQTEQASATAMLNVGAAFQGKRTWIRPSVRVGYRNDFMADPTVTPFRFTNLRDADGTLFNSELAELRSLAFPDEGLILGFTVAAGSPFSSIGFDFDSDIRDGFIRHTGRIVIRLLF